MRRLLALLTVLCATVVVTPASAAWTGPFTSPVTGNPADALAELPIEDFRYDRATRCSRKTPAPGAVALARWLRGTTKGSSWGVARCERLRKAGRGSAPSRSTRRRSFSLHAEGRALDWRLDARKPAERAAARRLIALLLAPDRLGNPAALARRMGIQEIIFDCRAWFGGKPVLRRYAACDRKRVSRTTAHRDHVHLGLTRDGAAKRTSFWTREAPPEGKRDEREPGAPIPDVPADEGEGDADPWEELVDEPDSDGPGADEPVADEATADDPGDDAGEDDEEL